MILPSPAEARLLSSSRSGRRLGFTLIEIMVVILLLAIIAGVVLPSSQPKVHEQLRAATRIVASELELCRSLAIAYNSRYQLTIDFPNNRLILRHSGTNAILNNLPRELLEPGATDRTARITSLAAIANTIGDVRPLAAAELGTSLQAQTTVEFGPNGTPTSGKDFIIWLIAGRNSGVRYATVIVDHQTGKVVEGPLDALPPPPTLLPQQ